jgi:HlyD family secretion protein
MNEQARDPDISALLAAGRASRRRPSGWPLLILVFPLLLAGVAVFWWIGHPVEGVRYVTAKVTQGNLTVTVTATGNLQPINTVDVGSEISGTVAAVLVDFNDKVKKGQILARLDTTKLQTTLERSRATLAANQAKVEQARATLEQTQSSLARLEDVAKLSGGQVPAATELDTAHANLDRARADLATALATVEDSIGAVKQGETDLSKAIIRSSINGVVLKRSVDRGQTVAASLQAPILFSLAEDLSEMKLLVSVSEADVGQVREGQSAIFTVDAYPDKVFPATIQQIRYGSTTVDNVVSYQTVLLVKNPGLQLRPGMTATADIKVAEHRRVMLVPNAALRFKPVDSVPSQDKGLLSVFALHPKPLGLATRAGVKHSPTVWIVTSTGLKPVSVKTILTDGKNTEIETSELKPGESVVTDIEEPVK